MNLNIPKPSDLEIENWLKKWDALPNYVAQECSLEKLFQKTYPFNKDLDDVLIKVSSLNKFYSTNIFNTYIVAKHIVDLKIDSKLERDDLSVVKDIAEINMPNNKSKTFYSFATKYCSQHKPKVYPIYDSFVERMLIYFNKEENFAEFSNEDFKTYESYKDILIKFIKHFNLEAYDLKQIDKYLWQVGKKYFPRETKKKSS